MQGSRGARFCWRSRLLGCEFSHDQAGNCCGARLAHFLLSPGGAAIESYQPVQRTCCAGALSTGNFPHGGQFCSHAGPAYADSFERTPAWLDRAGPHGMGAARYFPGCIRDDKGKTENKRFAGSRSRRRKGFGRRSDKFALESDLLWRWEGGVFLGGEPDHRGGVLSEFFFWGGRRGEKYTLQLWRR